MSRLLFLWDAAAFGGHDVSALVALERLAACPELAVGALHTGRTPRLTAEVERLARCSGRLDVIGAKAAPTRSESLDGIVGGPRTRSLREAIRAWRPDWAVNVQGFITLGLCATGACRSLQVPLVSYLPMTHRIWTLRRSAVSLAQDLVDLYWYAVPAAFITTSDRMREKLVREHRVPRQRVAVVEYGPDTSQPPAGDRAAARRALGAGDELLIGVIGRVEFGQKRQDFLIRAVARDRDRLHGHRFAIVGDGPDLEAARRLAAELRVADLVRFLPWQPDMQSLYPGLDAVLLPSRYEGVPLVMLEAMYHRVPVLASAVDGMADFLPPECLFPPGDAGAMLERLLALPGRPDAATLDRLERLIVERLNAKSFAERFAAEILRLTGPARR